MGRELLKSIKCMLIYVYLVNEVYIFLENRVKGEINMVKFTISIKKFLFKVNFESYKISILCIYHLKKVRTSGFIT